MKLRYKELEIETASEGWIGVEDFSLTQELNSHAFLCVKLLVKEETAEQSVGMADTFPVTVREMVRTKGKVIFKGEAECVCARKENGLSYLSFEAYSLTKEWERIEKSRSFLDGSLTYMDVAARVLSDYGNAGVKDEITGERAFPECCCSMKRATGFFCAVWRAISGLSLWRTRRAREAGRTLAFRI